MLATTSSAPFLAAARTRAVGLGLVAALATSLAACGSSSSDDEQPPVSARDAQRLLTQTPWLDHLPAHEGDTIDLLQLDRRGQGVYVHGNAYRGSYEAFRYTASSDQLELEFLDSQQRTSTGYRIERFRRQGFDLRLVLSDSPRGPSVYYGFDPRRGIPAAVRAVLPPRLAPPTAAKAAQ